VRLTRTRQQFRRTVVHTLRMLATQKTTVIEKELQQLQIVRTQMTTQEKVVPQTAVEILHHRTRTHRLRCHPCHRLTQLKEANTQLLMHSWRITVNGVWKSSATRHKSASGCWAAVVGPCPGRQFAGLQRFFLGIQEGVRYVLHAEGRRIGTRCPADVQIVLLLQVALERAVGIILQGPK
jgi:hypothetical protein